MTRDDPTRPGAGDGLDIEQATLRYLDGVSEPEEIEALFERLKRSPADRRVFVRLSRQSAAIREWSGTRRGRVRHELPDGDADARPQWTLGTAVGTPAAKPRPNTARRTRTRTGTRGRWRLPVRPRLAVAAALLLCASLAGLVLYGVLSPASWPEGRMAKVVAVYQAEDQADGGSGTGDRLATFAAGDTLTTEAQTFYHIRTRSGVDLYVEGASELTFNRAGEVSLQRGGLTANVPQSAVGFVVKAPGGDLIDLGTAFAVHVDEHGGCVVNVSQGRVRIQGRARGSTPRELSAGDAGQLSSAGQITTVPGGSGSASVVRGLPESAHAATLLTLHPAGYLTFDRGDLSALVMTAPAGDGAAWSESIEVAEGGPLPGAGRYAALSSSDQPAVLPGVVPAPRPGTGYTFTAWVRPDTRASQNIFTVTGPAGPSRLTGPQLRLRPDGIVEHVGPGGTAVQRATRPIKLDEWAMVTMTMDADRRMRLYLDGVSAGGATTSPVDRSASMSDLAIGGPAGQRRDVSHHMFAFAGGLDELAWFGRALSADEIERLFRSRDK